MKTILFDADSLLWSSCYKEKENPDDSPFNDNIEEVIFKFDEVFMSIEWTVIGIIFLLVATAPKQTVCIK